MSMTVTQLAAGAIRETGFIGSMGAAARNGGDDRGAAPAQTGGRFRALRLLGLVLAAIVIIAAAIVAGLFSTWFARDYLNGAQIQVAPETLTLVFPAVFYPLLALATLLRPRSVAPDQWRAELGWKWPPMRLRLFGSLLGIQLLCLVWIIGLHTLVRALTSVEPTTIRPPVGSTSLILVLVLVAPIAEEMFFRGWLQARAARLVPAWGATVLTSVLFALGHYEGSLFKPAISLAMSFGAGWLRQRSGSVVPGILLHVMNNSICAAALRLA